MEEVKLAVASNIIKLRTAAGMTQAELGEKLNYSDKAVSKWERADALPDVIVLKQIGDIFDVTVDFLINPHTKWEKPQPAGAKILDRSYSYFAITIISIVGIWTLAAFVFVIYWIMGTLNWNIFAYAVPLSLIDLLVFNSVWFKGRHNSYIIAALVFSIIALIYVAMIEYHPWQLLLIIIPCELIVFLSFKIRKKVEKN